MEVEKQLRDEIEKWYLRLEQEVAKLQPIEHKGIDFITNIKAYQHDAMHFLEKGDLVRSFEAVIWAWSWIEILKELDVLA